MKLFFYNRTSLSNVIIRKYFVCDISLDSIPQSCKSIFSNSPRKQLLLYFLVRQQATARQSNTWSSSSNMSDPDDSNIWILRIQTALSRWGARDLTLLCLWCSSPRPAYRQPSGCPYVEMLKTCLYPNKFIGMIDRFPGWSSFWSQDAELVWMQPSSSASPRISTRLSRLSYQNIMYNGECTL